MQIKVTDSCAPFKNSCDACSMLIDKPIDKIMRIALIYPYKFDLCFSCVKILKDGLEKIYKMYED